MPNNEVVEELDAAAQQAARDDTGRHWRHRSAPATAPAVDVEADRAAIAVLVDAYDAAGEAEIEAQRRGQIARKIAAALPRGIRQRERAEVLRRIEAGENVDTVVLAIKAARSEAKAMAAADLAVARIVAPHKPESCRRSFDSYPCKGHGMSAGRASVRMGEAEFATVDPAQLQTLPTC